MAVSGILRRFANDRGGAAAVEMALIGSLLVGVLMNVVEVGRFAQLSMQIASASQAGAQAAIITCDTQKTPITINCPAAAAAINTALRGTSLGAAVELHGALNEAWYCLDAAGKLQNVGAAGDKPANCAAVGEATVKPALYLKVAVQTDYEPLFPGLTVVESFSDTISRTSWMRLL
jgi:Flp pilus assembly protein TadG